MSGHLRCLGLALPLTFAMVILRYHAFQSANPLVAITFVLVTSAMLASLGAWEPGLCQN